jgi:hypothetical protein
VYREKHIFDRSLVILNLHTFNLNEYTPERENMTPNEKQEAHLAANSRLRLAQLLRTQVAVNHSDENIAWQFRTPRLLLMI